MANIADIEQLTLDIRKDVIRAGYQCGQSAHFGGGLSLVDMLAVLYRNHLRFNVGNPTWSERDVFILSKGHGVLGYFASLKQFGFISDAVFETFQKNNSDLIAHPVLNFELGIESSNGSLGQGLSFAAGIALACKKRANKRRVYTLLGDGECNEGSVWEAAMFGSHCGLDNLVAFVDLNGMQNDGASEAVSEQQDFVAKWSAFGWNALSINGHDLQEIDDAITAAKAHKGKPTAIIAHTIKGKGISFMENNNDWHHNRLTEANYQLAMEELGATDA